MTVCCCWFTLRVLAISAGSTPNRRCKKEAAITTTRAPALLIFLLEKQSTDRRQDLRLPEEGTRHRGGVHFLCGFSDANFESLRPEAVRRGSRGCRFSGMVASGQRLP